MPTRRPESIPCTPSLQGHDSITDSSTTTESVIREVMSMRKMHRNGERGISLVVALMALMLLSAVAIGMMFMSSTEAAVSSNFNSEETAYFAAPAVVEAVRDRILQSPPSPGRPFWLNGRFLRVLPG